MQHLKCFRSRSFLSFIIFIIQIQQFFFLCKTLIRPSHHIKNVRFHLSENKGNKCVSLRFLIYKYKIVQDCSRLFKSATKVAINLPLTLLYSLQQKHVKKLLHTMEMKCGLPNENMHLLGAHTCMNVYW